MDMLEMCVFKFLEHMKEDLTEKQFEDMMNAADKFIKENRVKNGVKTYSRDFIEICLKMNMDVNSDGG